MPDLSPQQFEPQYGDGLYHGTPRNVASEGKILPASKTSHKTASSRLSDTAVAYATESESTAWDMASAAQGHIHAGESRDPLTGRQRAASVAGRTRVYEVEPHPEMRLGRYHPDHENFAGENLSEHVAPEFEVKGSIDIKPGHQGTFPNLNWNQFSKHPHDAPRFDDPFNHPEDQDIEQGHLNRVNKRQGGLL